MYKNHNSLNNITLYKIFAPARISMIVQWEKIRFLQDLLRSLQHYFSKISSNFIIFLTYYKSIFVTIWHKSMNDKLQTITFKEIFLSYKKWKFQLHYANYTNFYYSWMYILLRLLLKSNFSSDIFEVFLLSF